MAEQIVNEFTVNRPIGEAWPIICNVELIAPCLPGAQLEEIEGDIYRGNVKVKLGAVSTKFKGEAHFVERDDTNHTAMLKAKGRDTGGRGNAEADIHATAEALSPTSTKFVVTADLHITGKVAQFGRGIMGDVSRKLIDQFSHNLNTMLDEQAPASSATTPSEDAAPSDEQVQAPAAATPEHETPTVRKIEGPAAEPVDLAGMAGPALIKRLAPAVAAVLLILLLLRRRR
jgi:carbon monoxide dehydrogenase subunit G